MYAFFPQNHAALLDRSYKPSTQSLHHGLTIKPGPRWEIVLLAAVPSQNKCAHWPSLPAKSCDKGIHITITLSFHCPHSVTLPQHHKKTVAQGEGWLQSCSRCQQNPITIVSAQSSGILFPSLLISCKSFWSCALFVSGPVMQ